MSNETTTAREVLERLLLSHIFYDPKRARPNFIELHNAYYMLRRDELDVEFHQHRALGQTDDQKKRNEQPGSSTTT